MNSDDLENYPVAQIASAQRTVVFSIFIYLIAIAIAELTSLIITDEIPHFEDEVWLFIFFLPTSAIGYLCLSLLEFWGFLIAIIHCCCLYYLIFDHFKLRYLFFTIFASQSLTSTIMIIRLEQVEHATMLLCILFALLFVYSVLLGVLSPLFKKKH